MAADAPAIAARESEAAERLGARFLVVGDPDYPAGLSHLTLPPPVLCVCGELPSGPAVAIVGSRRTDAYGQEVAELFARSLAAAGVTIVSGFARGIDAAAHRGALAAEGGRTVAVLGCGLGVDYPVGHERLGREIAARGALVSEFPCHLSPRRWHFPVRNRVLAALAAGTLVVQAAPRSGSLLTARWAVDLGREVWAIPGRIFDERSLGPNALIRDGAPLVQHPREILEALLPAAAGALLERPAATPIPHPEETVRTTGNGSRSPPVFPVPCWRPSRREPSASPKRSRPAWKRRSTRSWERSSSWSWGAGCAGTQGQSMGGCDRRFSPLSPWGEGSLMGHGINPGA